MVVSIVSLHDALPISAARRNRSCAIVAGVDPDRPGRARARCRAAYNARMPLITLQNVDYSVGGPLLLEHARSEEHTSELQSRENVVGRLLLEKNKAVR